MNQHSPTTKRSRTMRRTAFMVLWFALVGIAVFLSVTGLNSAGRPDYLMTAIGLLLFGAGVSLWLEKLADTPKQRIRRQAVTRWLILGLVALVWVSMLQAFLQSILQGRYLEAVVFLIFLRAIGAALYDQWNHRSGLDRSS